MKKIIFGIITGIILCGGLVYAANSLAKDVTYKPDDETWNVSNVEEALNDLYKNSKSNDSSEIIVEMSMTQSVINTTSWKHTGVCNLTYNNEIVDSFTLPDFQYNIDSNTTVGTTKIIEGKNVRLECNTTGSLNSNNPIITITLNLYVEEELVRTISIQNKYTEVPSLSDTWNIAGY